MGRRVDFFWWVVGLRDSNMTGSPSLTAEKDVGTTLLWMAGWKASMCHVLPVVFKPCARKAHMGPTDLWPLPKSPGHL